MNNKNKILVGCLALLLALSVGYAIFSDTITINGTATAKGDFNITPTCMMGIVEGTESYFENSGFGYVESGYQNDVCSVDDSTDTVTFSTELSYPGARRLFTAKMTNTGTIYATFPTSFSEEGTTILCTSGDIDADAKTEGDCVTKNNVTAMVGYAVQVGDGPIYSAYDISALPQDVQLAFSEDGQMVLKPGNSIYYFTMFEVSDDYTNGTGVLNSYISVTAKATFTQITN